VRGVSESVAHGEEERSGRELEAVRTPRAGVEALSAFAVNVARERADEERRVRTTRQRRAQA